MTEHRLTLPYSEATVLTTAPMFADLGFLIVRHPHPWFGLACLRRQTATCCPAVVLSDECEPVSVFQPKQSIRLQEGRATQREQWYGWP